MRFFSSVIGDGMVMVSLDWRCLTGKSSGDGDSSTFEGEGPCLQDPAKLRGAHQGLLHRQAPSGGAVRDPSMTAVFLLVSHANERSRHLGTTHGRMPLASSPTRHIKYYREIGSQHIPRLREPGGGADPRTTENYNTDLAITQAWRGLSVVLARARLGEMDLARRLCVLNLMVTSRCILSFEYGSQGKIKCAVISPLSMREDI